MFGGFGDSLCNRFLAAASSYRQTLRPMVREVASIGQAFGIPVLSILLCSSEYWIK